MHKCSRQFRQSDWTKRSHVGMYNGWCRLAYQNQNRAYVTECSPGLRSACTHVSQTFARTFGDGWVKVEPIVSATFEQPRTPQNYVRRLLLTFANVGGAQLVPLEIVCKHWRTFATVRASGTHPSCFVHVLWKCFVFPQNVNLPVYIWLYSHHPGVNGYL